MKHKIDSFDFIFLSFDEPNAELLYAKLVNIVPWAKRVHGVKGFDAAHRACADASDTPFFITVDGDNEIYKEFLDLEIDITDDQHNHAWTWAGRNNINGLVYGNGGLKLWSKEFIYNMHSHENAKDSASAVEFCWSNNYHEMTGCYSTSIINSSAQQAWRSGFREGVKMCLNRGSRVSINQFHNTIWYGNINRLCIWASIGSDVEHGSWAIYGALMGARRVMMTDDDFSIISDYTAMQDLWDIISSDDPIENSAKYAHILKQKIGLDIVILDSDASKFFKRVYMNPPRPWMPVEQIKHFMATRNV